MKSLVLFFLLSLQCGVPVFAQGGGKISGQLADTTGKPLDGAIVALLKTSDSTLVRTVITGDGGNFMFLNLAPTSYRLRITMVGYEVFRGAPVTVENGSSRDLGRIVPQAATGRLAEISVTGRKPLFEQRPDRTIVNVDAMISNSGSTALDVLEKSPGVFVDQSGTISLRGKQGVTVFIDDKPTYLSGADLTSYLRALPSGSLETVELLVNPPAKYDASGSAGVINIRTKRTRTRGFNGGTNLSYIQGRYARTNSSFNFNYRWSKFNLYSNGGYSYQNSFNDLDIIRKFRNGDGTTHSQLLQNSYIRRTGSAYTLKAGLDVYTSPNSTLGIVLNSIYRPSKVRNNVNNDLLNGADMLDSVLAASNIERNTFKNGGVTANYRHLLDKKGRELTFDADYIIYNTQLDQSFLSSSYYANRMLKSGDQLDGDLPSDIRIVALKSDYNHPLVGGAVLSGGVKASRTQTDNLADYVNTVGNITTPDYTKSNHFNYREDIGSAYLNLSKDWKKLALQGGLRVEKTHSDGYQSGNPARPDSTFRRSYTSVFPTLYLSYKTDSLSSNVITLNYGKRISRPYYQDLNPFIAPLDKFTYYVGNPFLKAAFTHTAQLSWTLKNRFTTAFSYSRTNDKVSETIEITNGTYWSRPGNIGRQVVKNLSFDANLDPLKWLNVHLYTELMNLHSVSDFYTGRLDNQGTLWTMNLISQLRLSRTWSAELQGFYRTGVTDSQFFIYSLLYVNTGIQKKIGPASTLRFNTTDLLLTRIVKGVINNLDRTDANWNNQSDSRTFALTWSWRFGKASSNQRRYESKSSIEEQGRVKG